MRIIKILPSDNGAYSPIQSWSGITPPEGQAIWPENLETKTFYKYNGFITPTILRKQVVSYIPNELEFNKWTEQNLSNLIATKNKIINETCENLIKKGVDVLLTSGETKHFSLEMTDQTNIDSMFAAITLGATEYPYHADGEQCIMYSAQDIMSLYVTYKTFVTSQTTYCNFLKIWISRETTKEAIEKIQQGDELPEDLNTQMSVILERAKTQIDALLQSLTMRFNL